MTSTIRLPHFLELPWHLALIFSVAVLCVINSSLYVSGLLFFFLLSYFLFDFKKASLLYLFCLLLSIDTEVLILARNSAASSQNLLILNHSFILDSVLGVTFLSWLHIVLFFVVIGRLIISRAQGLYIHPGILGGIFLPLITPLYGFFINPLRLSISDSSQFICTLIGFFLCHFSKLEVKDFLKIIFLGVMATFLFNLVISLKNNFGLIQFGAIGNLFPILLLYTQIGERLEGFWYALLAMINLFIFPGRSIVLGYFYTIVCRFCFLKKGRQEKRQFLMKVGLLILMLILTLKLFLPQEVSDYFVWKVTTLVGQNERALSSYARFLELQNILALNFSHIKNFFIGGGYGACFKDSYAALPPFLLDLQGSNYPISEIFQHCFSKPHTNLAVILLKSGLVLGAIFFLSNMVLVFSVLRRVLQKNQGMGSYYVLYFIPFWSVVGYNAKSFIVYGVFIYFLNQAISVKEQVRL